MDNLRGLLIGQPAEEVELTLQLIGSEQTIRWTNEDVLNGLVSSGP